MIGATTTVSIGRRTMVGRDEEGNPLFNTATSAGVPANLFERKTTEVSGEGMVSRVSEWVLLVPPDTLVGVGDFVTDVDGTAFEVTRVVKRRTPFSSVRHLSCTVERVS